MRRSLLVLTSLFCCLLAQAQEMVFEQFSTAQGLPSTQVYHIIQDRYGFMWFATDRGIARYNGYEFETFGLEDGLTDNAVFKFFPQKNGEFWCSTFNHKIFHFDPADREFIPYSFNDSLIKYVDTKVIDDLVLNDDGSLCISYVDLPGIFTIGPNGKILSLPGKGKIGMDSRRLLVLEETRDGNMLGYVSVDENPAPQTEGGKVISTQLTSSPQYIKTCQVDSISLFSDFENVYLKKGEKLLKTINDGSKPLNLGAFDQDHFFVGYFGSGASVFDRRGNFIQRLLPGESVTCLARDHEGGIWVSTLTSGVFYTHNPILKRYPLSKFEYVDRLARDDKDRIWVSTYAGDLFQITKNGFKLVDDGMYKMRLVPIASGDELLDFDWCSPAMVTLKGFRIPMRGGGYFNPSVLSFKEARVMGSDCPVSSKYLFESKANDLCWGKGGVFLATIHGLYFFDTLSLEVTKMTREELSYRINDIDRVGEDIYLATFGKGVIRMRGDELTGIDTRQGLISNLVNEIHPENDSTIWVGTDKGLNRIRFRESGPVVSTLPGISNHDVTTMTFRKDSVWLGTRKGLFCFPRSLMEEDASEKRFFLRLRSIAVNGAERDEKDLESLPYDENKLTFRYDAVNFNRATKYQFRYRLANLEQEWNYTEALGFTYPSIPPGKHHLLIQVSEDGKDWNKESIEYTFLIRPPFYKTAWFMLICLAFIAFLIYLFFRFRVLSYNEDVARELMRLMIRRMKKGEKFITLKEQGKEVRIRTTDILYIKAAGNYLDVHTREKTFTIRYKIGEFLSLVPDPLEFLRIHRSCIIRIDQVSAKTNKSVVIAGQELPVSESYRGELKKVQF